MKKSGLNKKKAENIYSQYRGLVLFVLILIVGLVLAKDKFLKKIDIVDSKNDLPIEKIRESVEGRDEVKAIPVEDGQGGQVSISSESGADGTIKYQVNGDLAPLTKGNYVGWLFNAEKKHKVQLGNFVFEKSGYSLYFETKGETAGYDRFLISIENVKDEKIEKIILDYPFKGGR